MTISFLKPEIGKMLSTPNRIEKDSLISDIVRNDYRTASVFKKYDIDFCCNGKWKLGVVCEMQGLDLDVFQKELENSMKTIHVPVSTRFQEWDTDFLIQYIINMHHQYLRDMMPLIREQLDHYVAGHKNEFTKLGEVHRTFNSLYKDIFTHMQQEEEILFPYIRQIAHAYDNKESYAGLLVRTLRKPVAEVMAHEHDSITRVFDLLRRYTDNYTPPGNAAMSHHVSFSMLKELDNDFVQHVHLENDILFPRAIAMENELMNHE
ncbi:MAG: DUF542 domain-containing protein [Chitinophagales bacterium]|nr:DUF542 domain-containing protein [Chitinophagales bacterium]